MTAISSIWAQQETKTQKKQYKNPFEVDLLILLLQEMIRLKIIFIAINAMKQIFFCFGNNILKIYVI